MKDRGVARAEARTCHMWTLNAGAAFGVAMATMLTAQSPTLDLVLTRTERYLIDYYSRLSLTVAEERFEQWIEPVSLGRQSLTTPMPTTDPGHVPVPEESSGAARRTLVSDFLMLHQSGQAAWLGFRDVLRVNGKTVGDRRQRLLALATEDANDLVSRAAAIAEESARYNIGDVFRTINVPTQALDVLHPENRARFSFRKIGEESVDRKAAWKIEYQERTQPFLIRRPSGQPLRTTGIAWIDPIDGEVLRTQLNVNDANAEQVLRTQIEVDYRSDSKLRLRVPVEMRETHELSEPTRRAGITSRIRGRARYQNFRRFETVGRLVPPR